MLLLWFKELRWQIINRRLFSFAVKSAKEQTCSVSLWSPACIKEACCERKKMEAAIPGILLKMQITWMLLQYFLGNQHAVNGSLHYSTCSVSQRVAKLLHQLEKPSNYHSQQKMAIVVASIFLSACVFFSKRCLGCKRSVHQMRHQVLPSGVWLIGLPPKLSSLKFRFYSYNCIQYRWF